MHTLPTIVSLVLVALIAAAVGLANTKGHTGRISVLLIGEFGKPSDTSWPMLRSDPRLVLTRVPAGDLTSANLTAKFMRIYMPRRYEDLVNSYDVIYHFDFVSKALTDVQTKWIHDAIRDEGLGFAMAEMTWYGSTEYWSGNDAVGWQSTVLYEAYPADTLIGEQGGNSFITKATSNPIVDLPGIEQAPVAMAGGLIAPRPGSIVEAVYRSTSHPAIVTGRFGLGRTFMTPTGWDLLPPHVSSDWPFFLDYIVNPLYFVSGTPIPQDLLVVHKARTDFLEYNTDKRIVISLMEFLDKWGANIVSLEKMVSLAENTHSRAVTAYVNNDYDECLKEIEDARAQLLNISQQSGKLKKQALFWVYLIEWSTVTGTLMIAGTLIWFLMIRRGLYREVGVTARRK